MKAVAIYARRSVADNDSLSIDSQIAECVKSLKEGELHKVYIDNGISGKSIDKRIAFQQMMNDAREGLISRIVVKKYDRFSRNMKDYLVITDELDALGVGVVSLTENFDTCTTHGRMMRNVLLSFAQFERESIQNRVIDEYNNRAGTTGFAQGGKIFGYDYERRQGGSVLIPSAEAEIVRIAYEMYKEPRISLINIIERLRREHADMVPPGFDTSRLSKILGYPVYVRANPDIYQYISSTGVEIIDDPEAFYGIHGLFQHKKNGRNFVKVGYHEGIIDADLWLAVQDRRAHGRSIHSNGITGVKQSWLVGLLKCSHCGYCMTISYRHAIRDKSKTFRYLRDSGAYKTAGCVRKQLKTKPAEVEARVYSAMCDRLESLVVAKTEKQKPDADAERFKAEIAQCDNDIRKLMDRLAEADDTVFQYINDRIKDIHSKKSELEEKLRTKNRRRKEILDTAPLTDPMSRWDSLSVAERNELAKLMLEAVYVSDEGGTDIRFAF